MMAANLNRLAHSLTEAHQHPFRSDGLDPGSRNLPVDEDRRSRVPKRLPGVTAPGRISSTNVG